MHMPTRLQLTPGREMGKVCLLLIRNTNQLNRSIITKISNQKLKRFMKRPLILLAFFCLFQSMNASAQEKKTLTGTVRDSKGNPLPGVTVSEKGSANGTTTDAQGHFKLAAHSGSTLTFSFIGFSKKEIVLGDQSDVTVALSDAAKDINEVVVTAMGIKRDRRQLGYAISTVSGDDIVKASPTNFGSALYGKAAGVNIQSAPGGGTSAVIIQIRGISSITGDNQPLLVVDGVPIRKDASLNTGGFWSDTRIRGNSLLDVNPENIASINILKGAAATALYGSDGSNGVVVITTKNGAGRSNGIGVDASYSYGIEKVSVLPDVQNTYGPGYDRADNEALYGSTDGFIHLGQDANKDGQEDIRPIFRAYGQFGPKFDGRTIQYWDGSFRKYVAHKDNWKNFYQTGHSSIANIGLSNANEKMNYRFSYTRNDYEGIQIGGKQQKNTFNFNTTYHISPRLTTDIVVSYVNEKVHNRPSQINRITANYDGMFNPVDDVHDFFNRYKTSKGYKYVLPANAARDPQEALVYNIRAASFMDFLWQQLAQSYDENSNRVMSSVTLSYDIAKNWKFRGRFGNDFTGYNAETKNPSEYPLAFGPSGAYGTNTNTYNLIYGDVLLSYNTRLSKSFGLNASAGYQARKEEKHYTGLSTRDGLSQENWYSLAASTNPITDFSAYKRSYYLQDGLFGIVNLDYKNYLFLELTDRQERISTLYSDNNSYNYPSASLSFELSRALRLPKVIDYSKVRASYGIVATPAEPYVSNVAYQGGNLNGIPYLLPNTNYGNAGLKPQRKKEFEVGLEGKMFNGRFGFDVSYYTNTIHDQILNLTVPASTGANALIANAGDLQNHGVEVALNGTPYTSKNLEWNVRGTLGFNQNKITRFMDGTDHLDLQNIDNGSLLVSAYKGRPAGDIMVYNREKDATGNYIIEDNGYYAVDFSHYQRVGNIQPKVTGGIGNTIRYKNFALDFLVDFRWGGQIASITNFYATGTGTFASTLKYRDAAHGGVAYYNDGTQNIAVGSGAAPGGATVYNDGVILKGNTRDGKANKTIVDAPDYYLNTFSWGSYPGGSPNSTYADAVYNNNFIKFRELSLNYTLPVKLGSKMHVQNLTVGVFGRNLFYFYKSLPNLDPEVGIGSTYSAQGVETGTSAASRTMGVNARLSF